MAEIHPLRGDDAMKQIAEKLAGLTGRGDGPHDGDGGGGGAMEARIAKLEAQMEAARGDLAGLKSDIGRAATDLTDIKVTLARIDTELRHKVDYKWLAVSVFGIAALIMREEIRAVFGN